MSKTDPTSLRFDKNDLLLAQNKSGIKKPQQLIDFLLSEYVRDLKPQFVSLPKDFVQIKGPIAAINKENKVVIKDISRPPKTLDELKAMCPHPVNSDERRVWISTERQKYSI